MFEPKLYGLRETGHRHSEGVALISLAVGALKDAPQIPQNCVPGVVVTISGQFHIKPIPLAFV